MLTVNRSGRPGLIGLTARTSTIVEESKTAAAPGSESESAASQNLLLYEAIRAVAQAEIAVARFTSARSAELPGELERLAFLYESGALSTSEFTNAKTRLIGEYDSGLR